MSIDALKKRIAGYQAEIAQLQDGELIDEDNIATKMHLANLQYWLQQDLDTLAELESR